MEETKNDNNKRCYNCGSYYAHFTKGYMRFNREKTGRCAHGDKVVGHKDTCGCWRSNQYLRRRLSAISVKALNETIAALIEITSVIKDDIENKQLSELARMRLEKKLDDIEKEIGKPD